MSALVRGGAVAGEITGKRAQPGAKLPIGIRHAAVHNADHDASPARTRLIGRYRAMIGRRGALILRRVVINRRGGCRGRRG
jgi:hypothetical protein